MNIKGIPSPSSPTTLPKYSARVKMALQIHLERLEKHRPLEKIADPTARMAAAKVRTWFKTEFLDALS